MSSRFHAILLFGYPGAGKGTQGDRLGSRKGFFHLATGDVFRSMDPDSEHGREFQYYAAKGLLVPDSLTMAIFRSYLYNQIAAERFQPEKEMLLLDGIP
ncbi:MAG: nucleoside monophosphate kinase, partial [Planctomycetota bacterium]|nr:nucleoside monophosphate kinase [Planctomycetota bacterium]